MVPHPGFHQVARPTVYRVSCKQGAGSCRQNYPHFRRICHSHTKCKGHISCCHNSCFSSWKPACIESSIGTAKFLIPMEEHNGSGSNRDWQELHVVSARISKGVPLQASTLWAGPKA